MNSCKEFEGKNVEKAVELACQTLNISKNQLKYDVISNGSSGIFSIIRNKKAKIRVNIDTVNKNKQRVLNLVDEAFGVKKQTPQIIEETRKSKPVKPEQPRPVKNDQPRPQRNEQPRPTKETQIDHEDFSDEEETTVVKERIISDFYKGKTPDDIGREVLDKLLQYITDKVEIQAESNGENLVYHVSSEDSAVIIGKRGQNLEAIQYIVDKIVNKHSLDRKRVLIDVEGYLEKRQENLEKMAIRMADKVNKTGKPSTISQMSSQDRRIVHLALKDNKTVRTQSMGEGYYRRLVIFPKKGRVRKKKA